MVSSKVKAVLLAFAFAAFLTPHGAGAGEAQREVVFPPPPAPARVKFLYDISKGRDLKAPGDSWVKRALRFVLGKRKPEGWLMVRPYGVCARDGVIYAADTEGASVVVIDRENAKVRYVGGTLEGRLINAIGVAVTPGGTLYVTDAYQHVVKAFGPEGEYLFEFGPLEKLSGPTGIALDPVRGRLLVADTGNSRIAIYDLMGKHLFFFGKKGWEAGDLGLPVNLAVDGEGNIFVSDPIRCRVQIFGPEGEFISQFGERGDSPGYFARPRGVAVDSEGHIYVADALFNSIQIFDREGQLLLSLGAKGPVPGAFSLPAGLFIDSADRLYVADSLNRRIQVFQYLGEPAAEAAE